MLQNNLVKDIRRQLNLTQAQLAEKLWVSFATVNRWEQGHYALSKIAFNALKILCENNTFPLKK